MCGIAGYIQKNDSDLNSQINGLSKMLERIEHRGPDGSGIRSFKHGEWSVHLGHRRLSIIDIAGGAQPLCNEQESHWITFNGEIYNFQDLRIKLQRSGLGFKTRSDTEVLVQHLAAHGTRGLIDLNGMFAFALWDNKSSKLLLARDRAGIKPLYYCALPDGEFLFSSELTSLIQHPKAPRQLSVDNIRSYFFSDYVPPPTSIVSGVQKLQPGHFVEWRDGHLTEPAAFWSFSDLSVVQRNPKESDAVEELKERLKTAVSRQLVSDVPVGVLLSGGIDSSLVAAIAASLLGKGGEPSTFTIGFSDEDFDESGFAKTVSRHLQTNHVEEKLSEASILDSLDDALASLDEPVADPSLLPTFCLARLAARTVKVALGGDGGDELFGGYPTYTAHRYAEYYKKIPAEVRNALFKPLISKMPVSDVYQSLEWKLKRFTQRWDADKFRRHLRWMSNSDLVALKVLFPKLETEPWLLRHLPKNNFSDETNAILALDFETYLPGSVLAKVDKASMANSLEVRPPLLDNDLMAWAFSLSSEFKIKRGVQKYLLKKVALSLLPAEIINRKKRGFAIPLARWLCGPLAPRIKAVFENSPLWQSGLINRSILMQWNDKHLCSREDFSKPLWAMLVLDHWMKKEGLHAINH